MKDRARGREGVHGWLEAATTFMQGLSRLLRYLLVAVLAIIALVFSVSSALTGSARPVTGAVGGLLNIGGIEDEPEKPPRPLFNLEIKPGHKGCPPGKSA